MSASIGDTFIVELSNPEVQDPSGKSLQSFKLDGPATIACQLDAVKGFTCSDKFVIIGSLVHGQVKPSKSLTVELFSAD
jgi:hypothetical protein